MGRLSEYIDFINQKEMPTKLQIQHRYTSIAITDEVKKLRHDHQKQLKRTAKQRDIIFYNGEPHEI